MTDVGKTPIIPDWFPSLDAMSECYGHAYVREWITNSHGADEVGMAALREMILTALTEAEALLPELPDNWWSIELTVRKEGPADRDIEALIWLTDDAETILEGHGPTNPAALADALSAKGGADE